MELIIIISQMKLTFWQSDELPGHLFGEVLDTISPTLLAIINISLINGVLTLKGVHLDPTGGTPGHF